MIEGLTWLAVKAFFKKACDIVKKYWQFFLGLSVGIIALLISRDSGNIRKALKSFREADLEERSENLALDLEKSEKINSAIESYVEREKDISDRQSSKHSEIIDKREKLKSDLTSGSRDEPGLIANEINKELDKI